MCSFACRKLRSLLCNPLVSLVQAEAESAELEDRSATAEEAAAAAREELEQREAALAKARGQIALLCREKTEAESWLFTDL